MSTFLKPLLAREELLKRKLGIFSSSDLAKVFNLNTWQVKYFLERQIKDGLLIKLKRGLYALKTDPPTDEGIANRLYQPSYLSFEYALSKYGIMPEAVYPLTSATTKPTATFQAGEQTYVYLTIKKSAYTGYQAVRRDGGPVVLIAEPEKALADFWYFVSLGKKSDNDRLNFRQLNKQKVARFADLFGRDSLMKYVSSKYH